MYFVRQIEINCIKIVLFLSFLIDDGEKKLKKKKNFQMSKKKKTRKVIASGEINKFTKRKKKRGEPSKDEKNIYKEIKRKLYVYIICNLF